MVRVRVRVRSVGGSQTAQPRVSPSWSALGKAGPAVPASHWPGLGGGAGRTGGTNRGGPPGGLLPRRRKSSGPPGKSRGPARRRVRAEAGACGLACRAAGLLLWGKRVPCGGSRRLPQAYSRGHSESGCEGPAVPKRQKGPPGGGAPGGPAPTCAGARTDCPAFTAGNGRGPSREPSREPSRSARSPAGLQPGLRATARRGTSYWGKGGEKMFTTKM
uniref:collagen alpha-1(I) chain-like n=1 Tax=Nyctereutes procyonoides TaxID=34880 RepID=UPI002444BC2B|nr:collagen alpha-1(I) chain-like [Nyctereutes procyonoides]